jgi:hypothetical protein
MMRAARLGEISPKTRRSPPRLALSDTRDVLGFLLAPGGPDA